VVGEGLPGDTGGGLAALPPGSRVAGYVLEAEIGAGGMAVVFRARDERLGRLVALKVLVPRLSADGEFRHRFLRESRAAAAVDDPHIIPVYEAGEAGGVLFIAMRYVSGGDVRGLLGREGPLAPGRAAAIISPVACALDAAHGAGLVHRDVKPGNMLIDVRPGRRDHVYLSDFGLARAGPASALTGTGVCLGTAAYMAPEQIQGEQLDGRADQYALGCVAFELLCGGVPFDRDQDVAVIYAHLSALPPLLAQRRPDLPPAVDEVLGRVLAKAPGDRYASCGEFAEALREALGLPGYDRDPGVAAARAAASGQAPGVLAGATVVRPVAGGDWEVQGPGSVGTGEGGRARGLPQGTVTFLFTDLEGSTRRWEDHPAQMRDALARHDTIVQGAIESHHGVVFSTMGDGMAAVFVSACEAVRAVLAAQQALAAEDWGAVTGPLAVRMGLWTGEGVPGGEHYLNQPLNRCARLMAAGHGGQVLVSGATELLVRDDLPEGCALVDLGEHRLRDLARPVRIFQLTGPGLLGQFPPLRTLEAFAGNLPVQLSSFVGRAGELDQLAAAMRASPLVTVTGPGGVGKTRLALQAAADQLPSFRNGAWLCELAPARDAEAMAQAVLAALRARPRPGISTAGSVVEFLRTRSALLLVLDNCEHLAAAAAALAADILRGCRGVRILATSQQPLGVGGEQVFGLRPLGLPPPEAGITAAGASDAVSLFAQRAAAARGDFALTPANVAAVGEICRRLDGIPLAIELAAARVAALRPAEIAGLLDERFRLLTRGRADAAARQQTLQATLEWSYALLGETDRRVFGCLGAFPASFDAEAAVAVAGAAGLHQWDVVDSLTDLVGKSLVAEEEGPDQTSRYRLLETMRAYARQQLAAGELYRLQLRHAEHYAAFAERAGPELVGPAQLQWQPRIRAERDNLQAAVTWALADGGQARPLAFRIVAALIVFAIISPGTAGGWADVCLAQIGACPPELRGMVIAAAASSAYWAGDLPLAQRRAEDALRAPVPGDPIGLGVLRVLLAQTYTLTGQPGRGASIARQARREAAEQGIEILVAALLAAEALAWTTTGDYAAARPPAMEAVEIARRVQNPAVSAFVFWAAANAIWRGDPQTALMLIEDSLALTRAGAFDTTLGTALTWAGLIRARNGDLTGALAVLQEAIAQQHADGNRLVLGITLQIAAAVLARLGEAEPAAVLAGAFAAHFPYISAVRPDEKLGIGEAQSLARHALGQAAYSAALGRGAAMDDDEVAGYAIGELGRLAALRAEPGAQAPEPQPGPAPPSRPE
jgi:predicted ATPase/class 3 adenylate cyclase/tRNA A-37 threonylcarbamoyl transferase component Bud32